MPIYEYRCPPRCGVIEIVKRMSDPAPDRCPHCGGSLERIYSAHIQGAVDANQESENDGMGKWYPQFGPQFLDQKTKTKRNPASHARSRYEAMEKIKRRGGTVEKT